jgi:hypothetical protein
MKPLRSAKGLVHWLLRISLSAFFIFISIPVVIQVNLDSSIFYLSLLELVFAVMLFIGGFLRKHNVTVISGIALLIAGIYIIFSGWKSELDALLFLHLMIASVALYFVSNGNRN